MRRGGWVRGLLAGAAVALLALPTQAAAYRAPASGSETTRPSPATRAAMERFALPYNAARALFLEDADRAGEAGIRVECGAIAVPRPTRLGDAGLTIDSAHYRAQVGGRGNPGLLVYLSGTHGVEGHAGSAVQAQVAQVESLRRILARGMDVLFVHALNPWGFYSDQRGTEDNVDLNRNCGGRNARFYRADNPGYGALRSLLEPRGSLRHPRLAAAKLVAGLLAGLVRTRDFAGMKQAVAGGQYASPKGLFYGGSAPEPQIEPLGRLFRDKTRGYDHVVGLDIHTGLGPRGALSIITEDDASKAAASELVARMGPVARDQRIALVKDPYHVEGTVVSLLSQRLDEEQRGKSFVCGTEHGTKRQWPIPLVGPMEALIETIAALVLENQGRHHGYASDEVRDTVQRWFAELFNPSDPAWRAGVLQQQAVLLDAILDRYGTSPDGSPQAAR